MSVLQHTHTQDGGSNNRIALITAHGYTHNHCTLHGLIELLQWSVPNTIKPPPGDLLRITLL